METTQIFKDTFVQISNSFEALLIVSYNTSCFLNGNYLTQFYQWLNNDISTYVQGMTVNDTSFLGTLKYGFKSTISRYFELIRFIGINYLKNVDHSTTLDPLNMTEFDEIDRIARNVIRYWYNNLLSVINKEFDDYVKRSKLINVSTFVVILGCVILLYCLVWKSYEENLKDLLETSVDLINLIPEEIKYAIVQKLNEEENKNE